MREHDDTAAELIRNYLEYQVNAGFTQVLIPRRSPVRTGSPRLQAVREELGECTRCPLHRGRTHIVFGEGAPDARVLFIGEGPGADEDREGKPFVGRAGRLLTKMIEAMGCDRSDVYIANVVKCRPPGNRDPEPHEREACVSFLEAQIKAVNPEVIVTLGRIAANVLLNTKEPLGKIRGTFQDWNGIPVMPTYHPSYLLRREPDRRAKREAWTDLKQVMALLGLPVPASGDQS
ncbi:MAG: uracil-DNA glycosylase [Desulfomonilaceae bacterium]|nr:uracil-DNA glycosylase [Desulfomonilaceae bacterium]